MKLSEYIKVLKELEKQGHGELELIYASDDEGNNFQKVHNPPALAMMDDISSYYDYPDFDLSESDVPNCICIN